MLTPLIDMLNHQGERLLRAAPDEPTTVSLHNAAWQLVPPHESALGEWEMRVIAEKGIEAGTEIFISYGPHTNDSFLLFYGFLPVGSPHDSVVLFNSVDDAVVWLCAAVTAEGRPEDALVEAAMRAAKAAVEGVEGEIREKMREAAAKEEAINLSELVSGSSTMLALFAWLVCMYI